VRGACVGSLSPFGIAGEAWLRQHRVLTACIHDVRAG